MVPDAVALAKPVTPRHHGKRRYDNDDDLPPRIAKKNARRLIKGAQKAQGIKRKVEAARERDHEA